MIYCWGSYDPIQQAESSLQFRINCQYKLDKLQNCFVGVWGCFRSICNPANSSLDVLIAFYIQTIDILGIFTQKSSSAFDPGKKKH